MALKDDRFSMSTDRYLAKNFVMVYLEDAICELLVHREENPKVEPLKYLCQYFTNLRNGNHTIFREFAFIRSTPHNRSSFVKLFWKCFRQIGKKGDLLSIQEYHSLLGLLCTDFPFQLVQKTARIVLIDDALDCLISFSDFIYAFQAQFFYEEFLDKCGELYLSLLQSTHSPRDPVIVPTSNDQDTGGAHQNNHLPADGVDSMMFFRSIYPVCDRVNYSTPPITALKEILFSNSRVSFYGFLMAIAKSEVINEHIGHLPPKAELLEGADSEPILFAVLYNFHFMGEGEKSSPSFRPPVKLMSGARSRPPSGSVSQRSTSGSQVRPTLTHLHHTISPIPRGKLSEKANRTSKQKQSTLQASDDTDDTSSDSSDN